MNNARITYKVGLFLKVLGSSEMNSKELSEGLSKHGEKLTPRQVTAFIKNYMNHFLSVKKNYVKFGGSYHNVYQVVPGALNI